MASTGHVGRPKEEPQGFARPELRGQVAEPGRVPSLRPQIAAASCVREETPSLRKAFERCISTVRRVTKSACAISQFEHPFRGHRRRSALARGQRCRATELDTPGSRAARDQLFVRLLGEKYGAAALCELERLSEVLARLGAVVGAAEGSAEVGERVRGFEPCG